MSSPTKRITDVDPREQLISRASAILEASPVGALRDEVNHMQAIIVVHLELTCEVEDGHVAKVSSHYY